MQPDYLSFIYFIFYFLSPDILWGAFVRPQPQDTSALLKTSLPSWQTSPNHLQKGDLFLLLSSQFRQKKKKKNDKEIIPIFKDRFPRIQFLLLGLSCLSSGEFTSHSALLTKALSQHLKPRHSFGSHSIHCVLKDSNTASLLLLQPQQQSIC